MRQQYGGRCLQFRKEKQEKICQEKFRGKGGCWIPTLIFVGQQRFCFSVSTPSLPPRLERVDIGVPRENTEAVKKIFRIMLMLQLVVNYDSGAIPSVLDKIEEEFKLDPSELGLLGGRLLSVGLTNALLDCFMFLGGSLAGRNVVGQNIFGKKRALCIRYRVY